MSASLFRNFILTLLVSGLVIQSGITWWFVYQQKEQLAVLKSNVEHLQGKIEKYISESSTQQKATRTLPAYELQDLLDQFGSLSARVAKTEERVKTATAKNMGSLSGNTPLSLQKDVPVRTKEHLLFLGEGSTYDREWSDIPSASVYIDTSKYGRIKEVRLEGALSIAGGEVHARLKNTTTGHIYFDAPITNNTPTSAWQTSAPITLHNGGSVYIIQLKSSSGEKASLGGARVRILVE